MRKKKTDTDMRRTQRRKLNASMDRRRKLRKSYGRTRPASVLEDREVDEITEQSFDKGFQGFMREMGWA